MGILKSTDLQLTTNFFLSEFLHPGDEYPADWILYNIYYLANRLQVLRDLLGKPIHINSGYRSPAHNKAINGASDSFHLKGMAADIVVPGMTAAEVQKFLKNWSGGLGSYKDFTHIDIRANKARWNG